MVRPKRDQGEVFREKVEAFLAESGMPDRQLGLQALNDSAFVNHLRKGRCPSLRVAAIVTAFMAAWRRKEAKRRARLAALKAATASHADF